MSNKMSDEEYDDLEKEIIKGVEGAGFRIATPEEFEEIVQVMEGNAAKREHEDREAGKKFITEENDRETIDSWYERASKMTEQGLGDFVHQLIHEYHHDYGTICHAIAAAAYAAAQAVERSPTGGITGFQAGAIMWEFLRHWMMWGEEDMYRLQNVGNMLYPQYEHTFKSIQSWQWEKLQEMAKTKIEGWDEQIAEGHQISDAVYNHCKSVSEGNVPFGFVVED